MHIGIKYYIVYIYIYNIQIRTLYFVTDSINIKYDNFYYIAYTVTCFLI